MSKKQHHNKTHSHKERREHDAAVRRHEADVYSNTESNLVRYSLYVVAAIIVVSLTLLFVGGFINW